MNLVKRFSEADVIVYVTPHDQVEPIKPAPDVAAKQDPDHTKGDFERDLTKATKRVER